MNVVRSILGIAACAPLLAFDACGLAPVDDAAADGAGAAGFGGWSLGGNPGSSLSGRAGSTTVFLGRSCLSDVDCGQKLKCLQPDSAKLGGEGPPRGYCTVECTGSGQCQGILPGANCHDFGGLGSSYCVLPCDPAQSFDSKCQGRRDVACVSASTSPECLPRCNSDNDCCPAAPVSCSKASHCNPRTGLCSATAPKGTATGTLCSSSRENTCSGRCVNLSPAFQQVETCADLCTSGSFPSCQWTPSQGPAPAYCVGVDGIAPNPGNGGFCSKLCDCDDDCGASTLVCHPLPDPALIASTQRRGVCAPGVFGIRCVAGGVGGTSSAGFGGRTGSGAQAGAGPSVGGAGTSGVGATSSSGGRWVVISPSGGTAGAGGTAKGGSSSSGASGTTLGTGSSSSATGGAQGKGGASVSASGTGGAVAWTKPSESGGSW